MSAAKPRHRGVRSCMRTKGRFARMGRRSAAGVNDGVIDHDMVTRRGLRAWRDGRHARQAGERSWDEGCL